MLPIGSTITLPLFGHTLNILTTTLIFFLIVSDISIKINDLDAKYPIHIILFMASTLKPTHLQALPMNKLFMNNSM
jgi:hypothetical protein